MGFRRFVVAGGVLALLVAIAPHASAAQSVTGTIDPDSASFFGGVGGTVIIRPHGFGFVDANTNQPVIDDSKVTLKRQGTLPADVKDTENSDGSLTITVPGTLPLGVYFFEVVAINKNVTPNEQTVFRFTLFVSEAKAPPPDIKPATCETLSADLVATTKFKQGDSIFVRGFLPAVGNVTVFLGETQIVLGAGGTDDAGVYLVTAVVPFLRPGPYVLVVKGVVDSEEVRATCGINVTQRAPVAAAATSGTSSSGTGTSGTSSGTAATGSSTTGSVSSLASSTTPTTLPATGAPALVMGLLGFTLLEVGLALWMIGSRRVRRAAL